MATSPSRWSATGGCGRLNRAFRGVDRATDVLSFPTCARPPGRPDDALGDVVIAAGVAARQAVSAGHALRTELRVLALHGLLHLLGYDHEHDDGVMARTERRLRRRGQLREGLIERADPASAPEGPGVTPLALFLLACAAVLFGTVSAAFSVLMRLSLRLSAERSDRDDLLGRYLDDPMRLFIPARIVLAIIYVVAGALLARVIAMQAGHGLPTLIAAMAVFALVCEHLIPLLLIRRIRSAVLEATLPAFHAVERLLRPVTLALLRVGRPPRSRRQRRRRRQPLDRRPRAMRSLRPTAPTAPATRPPTPTGRCCVRSSTFATRWSAR